MKKRILNVLPTGIVRNRLSFKNRVSNKHAPLLRVLLTLVWILKQLTPFLEKNPNMSTVLFVLLLLVICWLLKQILANPSSKGKEK